MVQVLGRITGAGDRRPEKRSGVASLRGTPEVCRGKTPTEREGDRFILGSGSAARD